MKVKCIGVTFPKNELSIPGVLKSAILRRHDLQIRDSMKEECDRRCMCGNINLHMK